MTLAEQTTVLDMAKRAAASGIVVLPAKPDGSKQPDLRTWTEFKERRPSREDLKRWFVDGQPDGLGFLCGAISGNLELLEFEDADTYIAFCELANETGLGEALDAIRAGYEETTPGGGFHLLYRLPETPAGNTKLAQKPCPGAPECDKHEAGKRHALIETRGEGGWVVVAPSGGRTHPTGHPYTLVQGGPESISDITAEQHAELWALARSLDEMPAPVAADAYVATSSPSDGQRPGDLFNAQSSWSSVLEPHGWRRVSQRGHLTYWRRPGKDHGVSATSGLRNAADPTSDLLYVFTTSSEFEPEQGYSKYRAYAVLNHAGDWQAAARDLAAQGYQHVEYDIGPLVPAQAAPGPQETPQERAPAPYRFDAVFPPEHFIERYVEYARQRTDAAWEYHEGAACMLLAAATPGIRARLSAWPNGLATNLYVVLVGDSTVSRKSTAMGMGKAMLQAMAPMGFPSPVFPDHFSEAAMLEQLALRSAHPSVWCPDELGQVLEDIEKKPQLKDALLTLYDSPPSYDNARHSKRVQGEAKAVEDFDRVQKPHWNILGATTPAVFDSLSTRTVQSGLLPRFAYVWPEQRPPRMGLRESTPSMEAEFNALTFYLKQLATWTQTVRDAVEVVFTPGTIEALDRFMVEVEERDETILARLPAVAVKLAMLSALGEEIPSVPRVVIEPRDVERAIQLARKWMRSAERFGNEIGGYDIHERKFQQRISKALAFVRDHGGQASRRDVMRHMRISAKDLDELQRTLIDMGEIAIPQPEQTGGRPSLTWVLNRQEARRAS